MSPSLSPFPPKLRNSESLACSSSSSTSFSSSSASSSFSALFDRNSRTSSEWSDITPPTSPSQSLDGAVKSMHGGQSTIRAYSKATFSEGLPTLLEDDEQADASYSTKLAKTHNSPDVRAAPRKAHSFLRTMRAEPARNAEPHPSDKAAHPPQLIITSPDEDVEEWTESLQKRQDEALALQADAVHTLEDDVPQNIDENDDSFSIESTIEAWLDRAKLEGNEFPGVESLLDEQFDFPSFSSDSDHSVSPPQLSLPRLSTVFRPILEPVPEDGVAPDVLEVAVDRPVTFWVLEPLPSPSLAPVPEEEEELLSPESMYTQATAYDPSETASLFLDADVDFSMPPTPRINPMHLGDSEFSPLILGSPKIRTTQTPSPRTPLSPRNRQDILHLASPLTTSDDSNHMHPMDVPAMMRLEIARTLANSHHFGQFTESASGFGLGLELISEESPLPPALFPSGHQLIGSSISYTFVHPSNNSDASDGSHHANLSEALQESLAVDTEVVGLGLGKLAEAVLQSSSSVTSKMDDECLAVELNEAPLSTGCENSPRSVFRTLGPLEQGRVEAAQYVLALEASTASGRQRLNLGSDAAEALSNVPNSAVPKPHTSVLTPRSALSSTRGGEHSSPLPSPSPPKAPGPLSSGQVLCTQIRSSRLPAPRLSPIQEDDSTPETFGIVDLDGDYGFIIVPSQEGGDFPTSSLAEHSLASQHPGVPRYAVQPTPQREASLNTEQQVAQSSANLPPIKARSWGTRGALHPLLFVEPTLAEVMSGSRGSDAQRPIAAPSTSTPLTAYPGVSKIPAPRTSQIEVKPHSFLLPSSNQSSGSSSSPPPSAKGKAPLRRRFSGGSKVRQTSEVERAPSKNKKPAATKSAPAPVVSAIAPTSFLSRFGLHRLSVAREYDDPALRMSVPSVLSAKTDPRSPQVEGQRPIAPPRLSRKAAPTTASDRAPPVRSSSVKSTKTVGVLGKGLPSHLASRPPQPRNASSSSTRPSSSLVGASASASASSAQRSTSPPRGFLQIARFARRQLYAIPEVPTPSPTFSASAGSTPILQSPRKPGVLRRLLSPKKTHGALDASPLPPAASPQEIAAAKKSTAPQARRSSIPQPRQLPSRPTGPSGRQPSATANYHPSMTAVSEFRDLPAETDPGRSPLPFVEHADAPRNIGLLKRGTNRAAVETSRTQMGSPFTRKLRCLF